MSRQTTLFGTTAKKGRFFKEIPNAVEEDDGYYAVIEAMWTLEKSYDRNKFFSRAQKEWTVNISSNSAARADIIGKAKAIRSGEGRQVGKNFFSSSAGSEPPRVLTASSQTTSAPSAASSSSLVSDRSVPESIVAFCNDMAVPVNEFFTEDVVGQTTFVRELEGVCKKWVTCRSELAVNNSGAQYKWTSSQLQSMIDSSNAECPKLAGYMQKVAAIKISASQLLTSAMSSSIAEKMQLLSSMAAHLPILGNNMNHLIQRLQIRNDQMKSRHHRAHSDSDIRIDCCNAEVPWSDAIASVHDAVDKNRCLTTVSPAITGTCTATLGH